MIRISRKFVAVLLAVWLPIFSGYALANSISMQNMHDDCHGAQHMSHPSQKVSDLHKQVHHVQLSANVDHSDCQHDSQSSCNNYGVCQFASSGYMTSLKIDVAEAQPTALTYTIFTTQFQSITIAPLDPPPLARV